MYIYVDINISLQDVKNKTVSLWSFINSNLNDFVNPLHTTHQQQHILFHVASMRCMKLWKGYYCRWNPRMRPQVCLVFFKI